MALQMGKINSADSVMWWLFILGTTLFGRVLAFHCHLPTLVLPPRTTLLLLSESTSDLYELVVVGAGPAGTQAVVLAAATHGRVALIDAPRASGMLLDPDGNDLSLGGPTGLFSKALRDTSKRIKVSTLRGMGLREDSVWNEIINNCVSLAKSNAQDIQRQLDMAKVECIQGFASFPEDCMVSNDTNESTIKLKVVDDINETTRTIYAKRVLLATGSKPFQPKGIPFDGKRIFDSDSINTISFLPRSIAITGSGSEFQRVL